MKKHLFTLMIAFVLVMGTNVSALAQTVIGGITAATGTPTNPKVYLAGSTGSLSVTAEADHTYTWNFYSGSTATTPMPTTTDPVGTPVAGFDLSVNATWGATQTGATANFTWTESAAGQFYATVTDLNTTTTCSTVRSYHMFLMGYKIYVYASDEHGNQISGANLTACGDGTTYPAFLNNVALDVAGTGIRGDILNSGTTPAPVDGLLTNVHGTNPRTTRHYTAALIFDQPASGTFANPTLGSARMDIKIGGTTMPAVDVVTINGTVLPLETDNSTLQSLITPLAANPATVPTAVANQNGLGAGAHAHYYFTFPVIFNDRWGTNLTPNATIENARVYTAADGTGTVLGQEPKVAEAVANTSDEFIITGKPATSIITGN